MKKTLLVLILILAACTVFAGMYAGVELGFVTTSVGIGSNNGSTDASLSVGILPFGEIGDELFSGDMNFTDMPLIIEQSFLFNLTKGSEHFSFWVGLDAVELTTVKFEGALLFVGGATKFDYNFNGQSSIYLKSRLPFGYGITDFQNIGFEFFAPTSALLVMGATTTLGYSFSF